VHVAQQEALGLGQEHDRHDERVAGERDLGRLAEEVLEGEETERALTEELKGDDGELEVDGARQRGDDVKLVQVAGHGRVLGAEDGGIGVQHVADEPGRRVGMEHRAQHGGASAALQRAQPGLECAAGAGSDRDKAAVVAAC
jgi:hypothetical protein